MKELTPERLKRIVEDGTQDAALLFYTPFCGTCKLAERMLDIVAGICPQPSLYKVNINYTSEWSRAWKLESVPCVVLLSGGRPVYKEYRMQSVDHLYELLRNFKRC